MPLHESSPLYYHMVLLLIKENNKAVDVPTNYIRGGDVLSTKSSKDCEDLEWSRRTIIGPLNSSAISVDMLISDIANSSDTTDNISSCQHDNANAAVLSLLLLGSSKSLAESKLSEISIKRCHGGEKIIVKASNRGTHKSSSDCKYDDLKSLKTNGTPKGVIDAQFNSCSNDLTKGTDCKPNMEHICATALRGVNQDLSNALLSSSLVLGSLSKSRGDQYLPTNQSNLKRKRGILLPPSSRVGSDNISCCPLSESSPTNSVEIKSYEESHTAVTAASTIPTISVHINKKQIHSSSKSKENKERKSSAERYRQRNHRRKQFFGNKIVKVVELLVKYREMMSLKVRNKRTNSAWLNLFAQYHDFDLRRKFVFRNFFDIFKLYDLHLKFSGHKKNYLSLQ